MPYKLLKVVFFSFGAAMASGCSWANDAEQQPLILKVATPQPDSPYRDAILALHAASHDPLDSNQLAEFRKLIERKGWPPVVSVGPQAVNAAGDLTLWASGDYALQEALENVIYQRVDLDINGSAFAYLNDEIEIKHNGKQQYGAFLSLQSGRVKVAPPVDVNAANFTRDLTGLPTVAEYVTDVQGQIDRGIPIKDAIVPPQLAGQSRTYAEPELRIQLGKMIEVDQDSRRSLVLEGSNPKKSDLDKLKVVDAANLIALKAIFEKVGFPTVAMVGRDGVSTAFLLVQHADEDPAFQQRALTLAKPLAIRRELPRREFAMLTDRVLIAEGKKQLYGTQAEIKGDHIYLMPVDDPSNLNIRRASMSMGPESDYLKTLEKLQK